MTRNKSLVAKKYDWTGYIYIIPVFLFLSFYIYYGIGFNLINSFYKWNGVSETKVFLGLQNYKELFTNRYFQKSVSNTFVFMIVTQVVQITLGLMIAICLLYITKGKKYIKSLFFLPYVMSLVVIGVVFSGIFDLYNGQINAAIQLFGGEAIDWMGNPKFALWTAIIANIFTYTGFDVIMYQTGITSIPQEVIEASEIDGAGFFTKLFKIYIPMLNSVHFSLIILGVIGSVKTFEIVWYLTQGGPFGQSEMVSTYLYKSYVVEYRAGYSAAISIVIIAFTLTVTAIQLRVKRKLSER